MNKDGIVEVAENENANELLQQEHYYPFGMGIKGEWKFVQPQIGGVNAYQYNGKELNEDFGLNWNDYEARWYDASIGRWNAVDPLAEDYLPWSGYNYVLGNPIKLVDPDGKAPQWIPSIRSTSDRKGKKVVLVAEEGDNASTLAEYLNTSQENANKLWDSRYERSTNPFSSKDKQLVVDGPSENFKAVEDMATHFANNTDKYNSTGFMSEKNYNCAESAFACSKNESPRYKKELNPNTLADMLRNESLAQRRGAEGSYENVSKSPSLWTAGRTVVRFGDKSTKQSSHYATYLGTNKSGTPYFWTKNGGSRNPQIMTLEEIKKVYPYVEIQGNGGKKGEGYYNHESTK